MTYRRTDELPSCRRAHADYTQAFAPHFMQCIQTRRREEGHEEQRHLQRCAAHAVVHETSRPAAQQASQPPSRPCALTNGVFITGCYQVLIVCHHGAWPVGHPTWLDFKVTRQFLPYLHQQRPNRGQNITLRYPWARNCCGMRMGCCC